MSAAATPDRRRSYETVPRPFVPAAEALSSVSMAPRRAGSHPIPHAIPHHPPQPLTLKAFIAANAAPGALHLPRSMASQPGVAPFPHHEHAPPHLRLPPRPIGHGRSGSSAPQVPQLIQPPHSAPPVPVPAPVDAVASLRPKPQLVIDKNLPKAPSPGGLGLFVAPATPVAPLPPPQEPQPHPPRPRPQVRRATVSEFQRPPPGPAENDRFIEEEHRRVEQMWEWEQEQRKKEVEEQRRRYEDDLRRATVQQPLTRTSSKSQRKKSPESHRSASPAEVIDQHGIPTPPPSMSPSAKAVNCVSTKEERDRWRHEIRDVYEERTRENAARLAEEERLRRENSHRERARREAEAVRAAMDRQQAYTGPALREAPYSVHARREQEARRQVRSRRKAQRESGYLSSGRSADGFGRSSSNQNWRSARARRFYGEGRTDLREEGDHPTARIEAVEEAEWLDVDEDKLVADQQARLAKAGWDLYETKWAQFFVTPPEEESLRFVDIPWPSLEPLPTPTATCTITNGVQALPPSILQISAVLNLKSISEFLLSPHHSAGTSRRSRLRAALLRFHPDKVNRWLNLIKPSERDAVLMGVEIVIRCLNDLLKAPDAAMA